MTDRMTAVAGIHPRVHHTRFATGYFKPKLRDRVLQVPTGILLGHLGVGVAIALYIWFLQNGLVKQYWDHLFPLVWLVCLNLFDHAHYNLGSPGYIGSLHQWPAWVAFRHVVARDGEEGIWGGALPLLAFVNTLRAPSSKPLGRIMAWLTGYGQKEDWFDKFCRMTRIPNPHQDGKLTPGQYLMLPLSVNVAAVPGMLLVGSVVFGFPELSHLAHMHLHLGNISATVHGSGFADRMANIWTEGNKGKLIGLGGMFFYARRVFIKIGMDLEDIQTDGEARRYLMLTPKPGDTRLRRARHALERWFTEPHWPLPPARRAMFWHKVQNGYATGEVPVRHPAITRFFALALLPAMVYAWYYGTQFVAAATSTH